MEKDKNFKSNFIWNIIGTGFNAFNSLFFMIAVTRINGLNDAGIFTLAFSTACLLYVIGAYSGRIYQVTETNKNIKDKEFIYNRYISCSLMIVITIIFVLIKGYDLYKSLIFIFLAIYKCLEAFSDVLYGIMQKNDELNKVGKSYFIKSLLSVVMFILIDVITKNIILSCAIICVIWILVIVLYDKRIINRFVNFKEKINKENIIKIFKGGFFIFAITFLGIYLLNAPKYAIDKYSSNDIQAIFGIIIMPATVMSLVSQFLIHPYLTKIVDLVKEVEFKKLNKLILKIILYIGIFGIVASILAYIVGIPILSLVYGIDLNGYQFQLFSIIIAATLYNIGIVYSSVLTTIRHTFEQFCIYIALSIFAWIISNLLTQRLNMTGSIISYFVIMLFYFIFYILTYKFIISKFKQNKETLNEN